MDARDLHQLRANMDLTQAEMAEAIGLKLGAYHNLENERSQIRPIHWKAAQWAALERAVERGEPMMATARGRSLALDLVVAIRKG